MTQLLNNIYSVQIPLKGSPLKWINTFILKDGDRGLLIDTAFNLDETEAAIVAALAELGLTPETTDIFLTHMHVDHSGLVHRLKRSTNKVYASAVDAQMVDGFQDPAHWDWITKNNIYTGTPEEHAMPANTHVAFTNRPSDKIEFTILNPGDSICFAGYSFSVLDLRGHTPGQIGLYCAEESILFCGDHILDRITPNITAWDLEGDYLGYYLENLAQVEALNVQHLYTAHRELPTNANERIGYLKQHHADRLAQVKEILGKKSPQTAYEVARQMDWSMPKGFDAFPLMQKWFACSEALSHLQYLRFKGEITATSENEVLYYTL